MDLTYVRQLPKFLQTPAFADAARARGSGRDEEAPALADDYGGAAARRAAQYGDEDDVTAAARAGLGSRAARGGEEAEAPTLEGFAGLDSGAAAAEASARVAEREKAKGNRAFAVRLEPSLAPA